MGRKTVAAEHKHTTDDGSNQNMGGAQAENKVICLQYASVGKPKDSEVVTAPGESQNRQVDVLLYCLDFPLILASFSRALAICSQEVAKMRRRNQDAVRPEPGSSGSREDAESPRIDCIITAR